MSDVEIGERAPIYYAERCPDDTGAWRVVGPNGLVAVYPAEADAQAKADLLNEAVAEEREDDA